MPPTDSISTFLPRETIRLMLVDDDERDRGSIRDALSRGGIHADVVEVRAGQEALARLLGDETFDCLLMDNLLPDLDGLQMLAHLHVSRVTTPVIMMTGHGSEQLAVDLMKAGAADYLSKINLSPEHLARSVRNAVRVHRAENAARIAEAEVREQTRIAQALHRVAQRLVAERDEQRLVRLVTDESVTLVGARAGAFFPCDTAQEVEGAPVAAYECSASGSDEPAAELAAIARTRLAERLAPAFVGTGAVRVDDVEIAGPAGVRPGGGFQRAALRSFLAVPVVGRSGEVAGVLLVGHDMPANFDQSDERLLGGLANQAAIAIENARLYSALERGEQRYRFLAETIPQIVWTAEPDGGLDYFNGVWQRYSGQTHAQGCGSGWLEAVHLDDRAGVRQRWRHSLETGELYETDFRLRRVSDGAYRWHLVRATPMRDASGTIVKWFGTCTDVHDWRSAQDDLRIQRERLSVVLEASEVGLWSCDLPFSKLDWNARCKAHFHLPADALVDIDLFYQRLHPDDRARTREALENAIAQRERFDTDYRTLSPSGEVSWIRAIGRPFYDDAGQPLRFAGITVDITALKRSEETLRDARDAAEAANNAKDRFLAVLSHELRTPLMPVLTEVQALEMEPGLSGALRESLNVIRRNVELEARLIDDLLDLTRISKGKLQLNFGNVDLHAALRSAVDICSAELVAKKLTTSLDLSATRHHVNGDPARLQQVFWNLLKNAVKFTPPGGHLTIHTFNEADAVKVLVSDTGIGIEPEALSRIFDAFEQANETVMRRFGGLGLGLAISKVLIDLHGGELRASSPGAGKGSTFTVQLPACAPANIVHQEPGPAPDAAASAAVSILLVDDHHDTNRTMARLLQRMGYRVRTADSVRSALDTAGKGDEHFDLLISDIGLPDGSGLELMRQLTAMRSSIKGIALSGFGMEEDVKKSKEAGFYEHLIKPINFTLLENAIRDLTARK